MIQVADRLWVGGSRDAESVRVLVESHIKAVINVAQDLPGRVSYRNGIEYAQVGLVDGPGNDVSDYCAAVLALAMLKARSKSVLVYDHDGGRAVAVAVMYLGLTGGRRPAGGMPGNAHCWPPWGELYEGIFRRDVIAPKVNIAHVEAYDMLPFGILEQVIQCKVRVT